MRNTPLYNTGDIVRKKSGSWWEGRIVGTYSTDQTPVGYCVQLDKPLGPVQIYPESALELVRSSNNENNVYVFHHAV